LTAGESDSECSTSLLLLASTEAGSNLAYNL
jgi:hypothetical protein